MSMYIKFAFFLSKICLFRRFCSYFRSCISGSPDFVVAARCPCYLTRGPEFGSTTSYIYGCMLGAVLLPFSLSNVVPAHAGNSSITRCLRFSRIILSTVHSPPQPKFSRIFTRRTSKLIEYVFFRAPTLLPGPYNIFHYTGKSVYFRITHPRMQVIACLYLWTMHAYSRKSYV